MTLEINLERRAIRHLLSVGAMPIKRGQDGEPDRQVLWGGDLHFWIEFKKEEVGKKLRPGQVVYKKYLEGIGDRVYVVDSFRQILDIVDTWEMLYGPAKASRNAVFNG